MHDVTPKFVHEYGYDDAEEDNAFPAFLNGIERVKKSLEHPEEEPDEEYPNVRDKDEGKPMVSAFRGGIETRI